MVASGSLAACLRACGENRRDASILAVVAMPFTEVGVVEGLAVHRGHLQQPVWVPSQTFQGYVFARIRQYDDWLVWMVCNHSRRTHTLRPSRLWQKLLAASDGTLAQPEDDPLGDIMKGLEDITASKKRPRQRASNKEAQPQRTVRTVEYEEKPGSSKLRTLTLLQHAQHHKKLHNTLWLRR